MATPNRGRQPGLRRLGQAGALPLLRAASYLGATLIAAGIAGLIAGPFAGGPLDMSLWLVEPLVAVGGILLIAGLSLALAAYFITSRERQRPASAEIRRWADLTQQYFDTFGHDLGRPLRRILGKQRELRARLDASGRTADSDVVELLDEIEQQAPSFRLMMSNIQVLVELEDANSRPEAAPVAPARIVRNIADRYTSIARERGVEVAWWAEPEEFGIEYSAGGAIDHIVTNLVDNAVRFASRQVQIRLTKNPTHFFIRVWDDGDGISEQFLPHVFDRGWTPQAASQEERTSSGLGLHIARTLAIRSGGDLAAESVAAPAGNPYTAFTVSLPRSDGAHPSESMAE